MHYALGTWLARYKGQNAQVHQLKEAFRDAAFNRSQAPARYRTANQVYSLLFQDDCAPEWAQFVLWECEQAQKGDREDFSAQQQLKLLRRDLPFA